MLARRSLSRTPGRAPVVWTRLSGSSHSCANVRARCALILGPGIEHRRQVGKSKPLEPRRDDTETRNVLDLAAVAKSPTIAVPKTHGGDKCVLCHK